MNCELCGKQRELVLALVENIEMKVCSDCSKFGKVLREIKEIEEEEKKFEEEEFVEGIVDDYSKIIKEKREKMGMKQEDLAKKLNIKESIIHKIETGVLEPSMEIVKKLENFLRIKLITEYNVKYKKIGTDDKVMTLGDLIGNKK